MEQDKTIRRFTIDHFVAQLEQKKIVPFYFFRKIQTPSLEKASYYSRVEIGSLTRSQSSQTRLEILPSLIVTVVTDH